MERPPCGTPLDKQMRDLRTLIEAAQTGRRFKPSELALLSKSWLDTHDILAWVHKNRQAVEDAIAKKYE